MKPFLLSFLFVISIHGHAQYVFEDMNGVKSQFKVARIDTDTLYRYFLLDSAGKMILPPSRHYRYLQPDNSQRVPIFSNDLKLGMVDFQGKLRLDTLFYAVSTPMATESGFYYWAIDRIDTLRKITDPKERFIVQRNFEQMALGDSIITGIDIKKDSTQAYWGVVGEDGKWLIPPVLKEIGAFEGGRFIYKEEKGWTIADARGRKTTDPKWEGLYFLGENTFLYKQNGKYGLLSKEGKVLSLPLWMEFSRNICHHVIGVTKKEGDWPFWESILMAQEELEISVIDLVKNEVVSTQHLGHLDLHYFDCQDRKAKNKKENEGSEQPWYEYIDHQRYTFKSDSLTKIFSNEDKAKQLARLYFLLSIGERELEDGNKAPNYYELEMTPYLENDPYGKRDIEVESLSVMDGYDFTYQETDRGYYRIGWGSEGFGKEINTRVIFVDENVISLRLSRSVHSGCESFDRFLSVNYRSDSDAKMKIVRLEELIDHPGKFGTVIRKALRKAKNPYWRTFGQEKSLSEYEGRFNITSKGLEVYYGETMIELNEFVLLPYKKMKSIMKSKCFLQKYL
jgi:hypothetical protein